MRFDIYIMNGILVIKFTDLRNCMLNVREIIRHSGHARRQYLRHMEVVPIPRSHHSCSCFRLKNYQSAIILATTVTKSSTPLNLEIAVQHIGLHIKLKRLRIHQLSHKERVRSYTKQGGHLGHGLYISGYYGITLRMSPLSFFN